MELHTIGTWIIHHPAKTVILLAILVFGIWLLVSTFLFLASRQLIFNVKASYNIFPTVPYQQIWLQGSAGHKIDVVWMPNPQAEQVVLYLHGKRGRLSHFFPPLNSKYQVLAPAYPGYHESTGKPSMKDIYNTALQAYDYLIEQGFRDEQIIIFGHSMGGPPAVYTAAKRPKAGKLVLANTFSSLYDICVKQWGIFCTFGKPILNASHYAPFVHTKVRQYAFVHDGVVPYQLGEKLFTFFTGTEDKKFTTLTGDLQHSEFDVLAVVSGE